MAFQCGKATWASVLPDNANKDDGTVFVDVVHGNGNMQGRHRKATAQPSDPDEDLTNGKCQSGPEMMKFDRAGFHYEGEISGRVIVGRRFKKAEGKEGTEGELDGEEVWVGVKTGT